MEKYTDFTRLRTESDIKLAKITLKHETVMQERVIGDTFRNLRSSFFNTLKLAAIQTGTSILTAALIRAIQSRTK